MWAETQAEGRVMQEIRAIRVAAAHAVVDMVERGTALGEVPLPSYDSALNERLRELREKMAERDLYELLYGPLPPGAVNPDSRRDPFANVPASAPDREGGR